MDAERDDLMYVVMLNGHAGCLKTTLSYLLAPALQLGHISTSVLGTFIPQREDPRFLELRDQRYRIAAEIAEVYLKRGVSIVLDGTYTLRRWREKIYEMAHTYDASDVIAVTCTCSRPEVVKERFAYRRRVRGVPDAAANSVDAYWGSVEEFEPIEDDRLPDGRRPSHLEFDSGIFGVTVRECNSQDAEDVAAVLRYLVSSGRLAEPLFTSPDSSSIALSRRTASGQLWVELEGIGGSGKTAQCHHLTAALRSAFPGLRIVAVDEFSASSLGDFLRSRLVYGFRLNIGQVPPSLLECLAVLADAVHRGEACARNGLWDIAIFDEYRWTHVAHTLALIPPDTNKETREHIRYAVEVLINRLPPLPGEGVTFFLDCPVEVAIKRLEKRHHSSFRAEHLAFLRRLEAAYEDILAANPDIYQIDATQPEEIVTRDILRVLKHQLRCDDASQPNRLLKKTDMAKVTYKNIMVS